MNMQTIKIPVEIDLGPNAKRTLQTVQSVAGAIKTGLESTSKEELEKIAETWRSRFGEERAENGVLRDGINHIAEYLGGDTRELEGTVAIEAIKQNLGILIDDKNTWEMRATEAEEIAGELRDRVRQLETRDVNLSDVWQAFQEVRRIVNLPGDTTPYDVVERVQETIITSEQFRAFVRHLLVYANEGLGEVDSGGIVDEQTSTPEAALRAIKEAIESRA